MTKDKVYQINNSVTFSGKHMGSEEFLNQLVEVLGITIDRRPKGRLRNRKNRMCPYLNSGSGYVYKLNKITGQITHEKIYSSPSMGIKGIGKPVGKPAGFGKPTGRLWKIGCRIFLRSLFIGTLKTSKSKVWDIFKR